MSGRRAVFLDRDGTINEEVGYVSRPDQLALVPGADRAIARLIAAGFVVVVVTNQSGLARGYYDSADLAAVHRRLDELLAPGGARVDAYYHCPHHPQGEVAELALVCDCRKPAPGMLLTAAAEHGLDLARSYLVGDALRDIAAGRAAGVTTILVETGLPTPPPSQPLECPHAVAADLAEAVDWLLAREGLA